MCCSSFKSIKTETYQVKHASSDLIQMKEFVAHKKPLENKKQCGSSFLHCFVLSTNGCWTQQTKTKMNHTQDAKQAPQPNDQWKQMLLAT